MGELDIVKGYVEGLEQLPSHLLFQSTLSFAQKKPDEYVKALRPSLDYFQTLTDRVHIVIRGGSSSVQASKSVIR